MLYYSNVLFDKASNFAMLSNFDSALDLLEHVISQGIQYKINAKKDTDDDLTITSSS